MDSQISTTLARYKFDTIFDGDSVEHTTHRSDVELQLRRVVVKTRWTRETELGSGAFGIVWREREADSKELRAVKIIPKRFLNVREVEALAELQDHPDLFVLFFGWFEDRDSIYLAMEYLAHGDLGDYIRAHPTQAKGEVHAIATQLLEGLVVLHERGICHRDLKPHNILLASITPIWVKISDFGISKRTAGTALKTMCGTPLYKAPELLGMLPRHMKKGNRYTTAVDLWALGVVIHEILTTQIPFVETWDETDIDTDFGTGFTLYMDDQKPQLDTTMLYGYCNGSDPFPVQSLEINGVSEEGIEFVTSLMVVNPAERASAKDALSSLLEIRGFCRAPESILLNPLALIPSQPVEPEYDEVLKNFQSVLADQEETIGRSHTDTLRTVHKIARLFYKQAMYDEALEWDQRALAGRESALGVDHPDTLTSISEIAQTYYKQGMLDKALEWYERALAGRERVLAVDHPDTLTCISEIGKVYYWQEEYHHALEWYGRALAGRLRTLGENHPDTLTSISKVAKTYYWQEKYDNALAWYGRALAGRLKTLGEDHRDTLTLISEIGQVHYWEEEYDQAVEWYKRALAGRLRTLGEDHPDTLTSISEIAQMYYWLEEYDEALKWHERELAGKMRTLGEDHPDTLTLIMRIARTYNKHGKSDTALEWYGRALAGRESVLGVHHADTLRTVTEMEATLHGQRAYNAPTEWYKRVHESEEWILGNDHPDTQQTAVKMEAAIKGQGKENEGRNQGDGDLS